MKQFLIIMAVVLTLGACSSKKKTEVDVEAAATAERHSTELTDALSHGNISKVTEMADSLSLFVDDLTPQQAVQVLLAFVNIHNEAVAAKNSRADLETLRKFVDVYDISLSVNGKEMRAAIAEARRINPAFNLDSLAGDFRERLTQYDTVQDGTLVAAAPEPEKADSTDATEAADSIPLVLRPAE